MNTAWTLFRNITSNWIGFLVHALVTFFLTPYVLHSLGDSRYGAWSLIVGLTGYYGLLDLGFRSGLTWYLSRHLATRDYDGLNRGASTGIVALWACGLLVLLSSVGLAAFTPILFNVPEDLHREVSVAILINGAGMALQFVFFLYSAIFTACQRYDLSNAIGIPTRIIGALVTFAVLSHGGGLIEFSAAQVIVNTLDYVIRWRVALHLLPDLKLSLRAATWRSCWDFLSFGLWNVLIAGSARLISYTDAIVIGLFFPPAAIARFALASALSEYFQQVFRPIGQVFFPTVVHCEARGDNKELAELYLLGTRLLATLSGPAAVLAFVLADDFYSLWIGRMYLLNDSWSVSVLFRILVIAGALNAVQRVGYQVFLGKRCQRQLAMLFLGEGVANLALSLFLVPRLGLIGAALGTLFPGILFQACLQPLLVCRMLQLSVRTYLRVLFMRPLLVTVVISALSFTLKSLLPVDGWASFFYVSLIAAVGAGIVIARCGLSRMERQTIVRSVYRRWHNPKGNALYDVVPAASTD
jgi:O-antigen/teichoic acid export membrane protein